MADTTQSTQRCEILRFQQARSHSEWDEVAAEAPLEIRVEGRSIAVIMRTPGHDRELAAGFALSEGLVRSAKDIFDLTSCVSAGAAGKGNVIDIGLANPSNFDPAKFTRNVFTSASCGVCSKSSIEAVLYRREPFDDQLRIDPAVLLGLPEQLASAQETFRRTGGLHACALFTSSGQMLAVREDVGRHNALDKLIGWALLEKRTPLSECLVLLSGRASFEMMQKAHSAGVPVVAAISAPSSLAVEFAREARQTLVGFLRGETMNVYSGDERLVPVDPALRGTPVTTAPDRVRG